MIAIGVIACTPYDDTDIRAEMESLKAQMDSLDVHLQKTNANVNALQTIVDALDENEYITNVEEVKDDNGTVIGYTITFAVAGRKTIYNGKDAQNPSIQAVMHPDLGVYCWQIDSEWLLADGKPVPVTGTTPQLKLDNGIWKISFDGTTWDIIPVTGENVAVVCQFKSVSVDKENNCVTFTTVSGENFSLPLGARFAIEFSVDKLNVQEGEGVEVSYTIIGADEGTDIYVIANDGWAAKLEKKDFKSGLIKISAPESAENGILLIGASNHKGQSDLRAIHLTSQTLKIEKVEPTLVPAEGGEVTVNVMTNIDYTVNISSNWIEYIETKAIRNETIVFNVMPNQTPELRTAQIEILDAEGNTVQSFEIAQDKSHNDLYLNWVYSDATVTPSFGYSEPAIDAEGNVYVISGNALTKISSTGALIWTTPLTKWGGSNENITPSLESDGSVVYTAGGGLDNEVGLYALNTADGSVKWSHGYEAFFQPKGKKLQFWRAGVAVGDNHLFVTCPRNFSLNAFSKDSGLRTTYAATNTDGSEMKYSFSCSPALTNDGVVGAKSGSGIVGANREIMEMPSEDYKTVDNGYYVPCGIFTNHKEWSFNDRAPIIAVNYSGTNYLISGGTESNNHHFHLWSQKTSNGLQTTVPVFDKNKISFDYSVTLQGLKQTLGNGGGGLVAGARNEVIISAEPGEFEADPYADGGLVAVYPGTTNVEEAFAYKFAHNKTVPGSCAVDNNGYIHVIDIEGNYFILKPDYDNKTVNEIKRTTLKDLVGGYISADSVEVKSSVKIDNSGKLYVNANFKTGENSVGVTLCFSFDETTGVCAESSWPQAGADALNSNRQLGY